MSRLSYMFASHIALCTTQVACDGATLTAGRTMCLACERRLEQRKKTSAPLRGERCAEYAISRRKGYR